MRMYDNEAQHGCISHPATYLFLIAQNDSAADAAAEVLPPSRSTFPTSDAIEILSFVNARGIDLRQHVALRRLEELARLSPDPAIREQAGRVAREIVAHQ